MKKLRWALIYFYIGYTSIVVLFMALSFIPDSLRSIITFIVTSFLFYELACRYLKKVRADIRKLLLHIVSIAALWAILSVGMDVLLIDILMPLIMKGHIEFVFFSQQSDLYWFQFPMFFVSSYFASLVYSKEERLIRFSARRREFDEATLDSHYSVNTSFKELPKDLL